MVLLCGVALLRLPVRTTGTRRIITATPTTTRRLHLTTQPFTPTSPLTQLSTRKVTNRTHIPPTHNDFSLFVRYTAATLAALTAAAAEKKDDDEQDDSVLLNHLEGNSSLLLTHIR